MQPKPLCPTDGQHQPCWNKQSWPATTGTSRRDAGLRRIPPHPHPHPLGRGSASPRHACGAAGLRGTFPHKPTDIFHLIYSKSIKNAVFQRHGTLKCQALGGIWRGPSGRTALAMAGSHPPTPRPRWPLARCSQPPQGRHGGPQGHCRLHPSRHAACPLPGSFCRDVTAAPSHGPRWARPGSDHSPGEPEASVPRPPTIPAAAKNTACSQAAPGTGGEEAGTLLPALLHRLAEGPFCPSRCPQGCSPRTIVAPGPSASADHPPRPQFSATPRAGAAGEVSRGSQPLRQTPGRCPLPAPGAPLLAGGQPAPGHASHREAGGSRDTSRVARASSVPQERWVPTQPERDPGGLRCEGSRDGSRGEGEPPSHTRPRGCLCEHPGHARLGGAAELFWELSAPPREVSDAFIYKPTGSCPAPASSHAGKSPAEPRQTEPAASPHGGR